MSEMIERVAVAISGAPFPTAASRKKARAAIEAMRKPTKAMFDEAMPHLDSWSSNIEWWHKMIDGALK